MSKAPKKLGSLVILVLATGGLIWLLSEIGWDKILWHLAYLGLPGFCLLTAIALFEAVMDAWALRVATLGKIGFWRVLYVNQVGSILNSLVAGDTGEVLKATLLSKDASGHGFPGTIVWNLAFRLSKAVIIIIAAGIAVVALPTHRFDAMLMMGLGCIGILLYVALDLIIRRQWVGRILSFVSRWHLFKRERVQSFIDRAAAVEKQAGEFRKQNPRQYRAILLLQGLARLTDVVVLIMALKLLGSGYGLALCLLVFAGVQLVSYILPLFPTRVGTAEGSSYLLFAILGLDGGLGAIFQVLLRIIKLMASLVSLASSSLATMLTSRQPLDATSACTPPNTPTTPLDTERSIQTARIQR